LNLQTDTPILSSCWKKRWFSHLFWDVAIMQLEP